MTVNYRKWVLFVVPLLCAIGFVCHLWWNNRTVLFSDPRAVRSDFLTLVNWGDIFPPSESPIPWKRKETLSKSDITFHSEDGYWSYRFDESLLDHHNWTPIPTTTLEVPKDSQSVSLPTGEIISLKHIATGYHTGKSEFESETFDAVTLTSVEPSLLKKRMLWSYGPTLMAEFETNRLLRFIDEVRIFNRDTRVLIGRYHELYHEKLPSLRISTGIHQWHPSPIKYVLDLDGGISQTRKVPLKEGTRIETPSLTLEILFIEELPREAVTYTHERQNGTISKLFNYKDASQTKSTVIGFSVIERKWTPSSIIFRPRSDQVNWGHYVTGEQLENIFAIDFPAPRSAIKDLTITSPIAPYRLIFDVDHLPGFPEENRDLSNLFDAVIPNRESNGAHLGWVCQIAQLERSGLHLPAARGSPVDFFPSETTLRDLTMELKRREGWFQLKTTRSHQFIKTADPPWAPWIAPIKKILP